MTTQPVKLTSEHTTITDPAGSFRTPPPPRNHLAAELRQIVADFHTTAFPHVVRERLLRLTEHVEQVGAEPAEHTLEALPARLDPEQTIRSDAADIAFSFVTRGRAFTAAGLIYEAADALLLADVIAVYIRDGSRPDTTEETTR